MSISVESGPGVSPGEASSIYFADDVRILVDRAASVARNTQERRLFASILRRAREDALELEILYRDLPHVFAGPRAASVNFVGTLERAAQLGLGDAFMAESVGTVALEEPCSCRDERVRHAAYMVRPEIILQLVAGIEFVTRGNDALYQRYVNVLFGLWDRTRLIDDLLVRAKDGASPDQRDRLAEQLQVIARDLYGPFQPGFDLGLGASPSGGFQGYPPPDGGPPWPGPDDGPPIPWPVGGERPVPPPLGGLPTPPPRGGPPGMVNFMNDLCVRMMRAGARGLLNPPVPSSTWADGIQGLSPELVCANEQLHIVGTGFGSTQPPQVVVLIGDVPVTVLSWSNSEIVVVVPPGTRSGCVGFRNESLEAQRRNQLGKNREALNEVSEALGCFGVQPPLIPRELPWVGSRPPCTGLNRFAGTVPEIDSFRANGLSDLVVAPGTALTLTWEVQNATTIQILRVSGQAPPLDVTNPTGTSVALGPFTTNQPTDAVYELRATNRCGTVIAKVTIRLRKVPQLEIEGIEFTQAIQTFWEPGVADNSIPLVANKNTFVRVFVSVDMNGFMDDRLELTATLTFGPVTLLPINGIRELTTANLASRAGAENTITGRPRAKMQREDKDHSFNFLIPAAMCSGTRSAVFKVTAPPNETPSPGSTQVTPTVSAFPSCTWATKAAFKVRYVRVLGPGGIMMTDQEARECILRAIDLLPTPPSDIAPAWLAEWNTTVQNLDTKDGRHELLGHLDDQHDCTTSEWLFPWEEDCPDDDGAVWVGLSNEITGGSAESYQAFDVSRNTLVAKRDRLIVAHELGHTLKLNHVNPAMHCGSPPDPDDDFDTLPDDGRVQERDIFDPFTPYVSKHAAFDIMTYACTRWISRMNWLRMFAKF